MSSTPSIIAMSQSGRSGCTGANPTPQLPIATVVTPWCDDGCHPLIPGGLAVIVGVDIDETRRHHPAVGIQLPTAPTHIVPDRGDQVTLDGDVGAVHRPTTAVGHEAVADHQVGAS